MSTYISTKEVAEKWNISQRRVSILCAENRICGAMMIDNMWTIPYNAEKPTLCCEKTKKVAVKPFVKWVGGKGQLLGELDKLIPINGEKALTKYAEPFVGGGALLFNILSKHSFNNVYISDINAELINAYRVVKTNVGKLINALLERQNDYLPLDDRCRKIYYYNARKEFNQLPLNDENSIRKAALFIFLNKTCFNGLYRVNRKGEFNVPMGAYKHPTICDKENLHNVSEALQNVTIQCDDYAKSKTFIDDTTLVYLDPPYRPLSATSSFTAYSLDSFDDNEQQRLAKFVDEINDIGAKVLLSNSDPQNTNIGDTFFEELYSKYKISKVEAARMINSNSEKRGKINELLICNY